MDINEYAKSVLLNMTLRELAIEAEERLSYEDNNFEILFLRDLNDYRGLEEVFQTPIIEEYMESILNKKVDILYVMNKIDEDDPFLLIIKDACVVEGFGIRNSPLEIYQKDWIQKVYCKRKHLSVDGEWFDFWNFDSDEYTDEIGEEVSIIASDSYGFLHGSIASTNNIPINFYLFKDLEKLTIEEQEKIKISKCMICVFKADEYCQDILLFLDASRYLASEKRICICIVDGVMTNVKDRKNLETCAQTVYVVDNPFAIDVIFDYVCNTIKALNGEIRGLSTEPFLTADGDREHISQVERYVTEFPFEIGQKIEEGAVESILCGVKKVEDTYHFNGGMLTVNPNGNMSGIYLNTSRYSIKGICKEDEYDEAKLKLEKQGFYLWTVNVDHYIYTQEETGLFFDILYSSCGNTYKVDYLYLFNK